MNQVFNATLPTEDALLHTLWQISKHFPRHLPCRIRQDYFLALVFYKAICDHAQNGAPDWPSASPDNNAVPPAPLCRPSQPARFVIPEDAHLHTCLAGSTTRNLGERLDHALSLLEIANPVTLTGLFRDLPFGVVRQSAVVGKGELLQSVLADLHKPELHLGPSRFLGFSAQTMAGQIFARLLECFTFSERVEENHCPTPLAVAHLMASLLAPKAGQAIYDPACGAGNLLAACAQWIRTTHISQEFALFGEDFSYDNLRLARMQLVLRNIPHQLRHTESLTAPAFLTSDEALPQFDMALCHPPETIPPWLAHMLTENPFQQFDKGVPDQDKAGFGFVLHMLACLRPHTGRMAVLLSTKALTRGDAEQTIRKALLNAIAIDSVIYLPARFTQGIPYPCVLVSMRHDAAYLPVYVLDASEQTGALDEVLALVVETFTPKREIPGLARFVSWTEIGAADFEITPRLAHASKP